MTDSTSRGRADGGPGAREGEKEANPEPYYGQRGRYEYLIPTKEFVQQEDWLIDGERMTDSRWTRR